MSFLNRTLGPLLFPSILWRSSHSSIHLTFDDGPHPSATPQVLELLRNFGIHATFFLLGEQVIKYPELAAQVAASGHVVGCHGMLHQSLFLRSRASQRTEIAKAKSTIEEKVGSPPRLFRPPYGHFDLSTLRATAEEGMRVVMWDVDSQDFRSRAPDEIRTRVLGQTRQGSIILLHDNELTGGRSPVYLSAIIENCLERGFTLAEISL